MRDTFEGAQHAINCSVCALCKALYAIMDAKPEAADIRRMHGSDLGPIKKKLYEYLSGWMGGPPLYQLRQGTASAPARKLRRCCKAR
jgi:truncated hemoglobin YjbI